MNRNKLSLPGKAIFDLETHFKKELVDHSGLISGLTEKQKRSAQKMLLVSTCLKLNDSSPIAGIVLHVLQEQTKESIRFLSETIHLAFPESEIARTLLQASNHMEQPPRFMLNLNVDDIPDVETINLFQKSGIDSFRLNGAFGSMKEWNAIKRNLEESNRITESSGKLFFDLPGAKIRVAKLFTPQGKLLKTLVIKKGDELVINFSAEVHTLEFPVIQVNTEHFLGDFKTGLVVRMDDGRFEFVVTQVFKTHLLVKAERVFKQECTLFPGKGINFPDIKDLPSGLTANDRKILRNILPIADIICLSFVKSPKDIDAFFESIQGSQREDLRFVIKIETSESIQNLPQILLSCLTRKNCSLLLGRGDLLSEVGPEKFAEYQDKVLLLARAAGVDLIVATEIMDSLLQKQSYYRPEINDLISIRGANCFLLNPGPGLQEVIQFISQQARNRS